MEAQANIRTANWEGTCCGEQVPSFCFLREFAAANLEDYTAKKTCGKGASLSPRLHFFPIALQLRLAIQAAGNLPHRLPQTVLVFHQSQTQIAFAGGSEADTGADR